MPHALVDAVLQVEPEQQPAQLALQPLHTPPPQVSPPGQGAQSAPPAPHAELLVPAWQVPSPAQQPVQLAGEQGGGDRSGDGGVRSGPAVRSAGTDRSIARSGGASARSIERSGTSLPGGCPPQDPSTSASSHPPRNLIRYNRTRGSRRVSMVRMYYRGRR